MKKTIIAPLCSAFVIPGLGQIVNQQLKKGACILGAVFVLFVLGILILSRITIAIVQSASGTPLDADFILRSLRTQDLSLLWVLIVAFMILWFYSVLDAFLVARKKDGTV